MLPLRWWAHSAPPGCNRVKVSENLGATAVAPVAPADTSLEMESHGSDLTHFLEMEKLFEIKKPLTLKNVSIKCLRQKIIEVFFLKCFNHEFMKLCR